MPESFDAAIAALRAVAYAEEDPILDIANRIESAHQRYVAMISKARYTVDDGRQVNNPITANFRPLIKTWRSDRMRMRDAGLLPSEDEDAVVMTAEYVCDAIDLITSRLEQENEALFEEVRRLVREGREDA